MALSNADESNKTSSIQHLTRNDTTESITLPKDVFEKLYLTPQLPVKGELRRTFGNPTPMALLGFLMTTTPFGCAAMGWRGAELENTLLGVYYFFGGTLQILGAIMEFVLGNTFPCVLFGTFGSFWLALGVTVQYVVPTLKEPAAFFSSFAFVLCFLGVLSTMYLVCSLRTNVVFVFIFVFLVAGIELLAASYWYAAQGDAAQSQTLQKAGGACVFVFSLAGWYLLFSMLLQAVDFPLSLPVGDLSGRFKGMSARKQAREESLA